MSKKTFMKLSLCFSLILISFSLNGCSTLKDRSISKEEIKIEDEKVETQIMVDEEEILSTIEDLALQVRKFGTEGEKISADKLKSKLESYGYDVDFQDFEVFDMGDNIREYIHSEDVNIFFNLNPTNSTSSIGTARNIIAKSKDFDVNKKTLYLSAHYDTTSGTTGVYDNATGVSAVVEIARNLQNYKNDEINIVYTIFSAEEYFKSGSRYYLSQLSNAEKDNIIGAINIDMIGYEGFEYPELKTVGPIEIILMQEDNNTLSDAFNNQFNEKYNINSELGGMSDDLSFSKLGIPTIYFADENFMTGFNIEQESTNIQLEPVKVNAIYSFCEDIVEFVKNL
ncbi:M28 family metallopeptidase [Romboutsia ilealis]|uniref:Aminopeptidase, M28 family n=1 Tax=Romboutsia ilealis TaxID=1115758 RepID=A0A1V1I081_9FIRM|nr:M28 family peptidase [Romboutsia ilealis]CED93539.1 Aminopeptidase, M28 family [Romboutsia ilealis]